MTSNLLKIFIVVCVSTFFLCNIFDSSGPGSSTPAGYKNDVYEPNDNQSQAWLLPSDTLTNLLFVPEEKDWFKFFVDSNTYFLLFVKSENPPTAELYLYNSTTSAYLQYSTTQIAHYVSRPDTFYVSISMLPGKNYYGEIPYSIRLNKEKLNIVDFVEPNNTKATATSVSEDTYSAFIANVNDSDVYKMILTKGDYVTATLSVGNDEDSSLHSYLTTSDSITIVKGSQSGKSKRFSYMSSKKDSCFFYVYAPTNAYLSFSPIHYTASFSKFKLFNDRFEDNNTKFSAEKIVPGTYDSLVLFSAETDFYKFSFDSAMYIEAVIISANKPLWNSYLTISLETISTSLQSAGSLNSDSSKITYFVSPRDTLYLRIANISSEAFPTQYSLKLRATPQ